MRREGLNGNKLLRRPEWAPPGTAHDKRKGKSKMHGQIDVKGAKEKTL